MQRKGDLDGACAMLEHALCLCVRVTLDWSMAASIITSLAKCAMKQGKSGLVMTALQQTIKQLKACDSPMEANHEVAVYLRTLLGYFYMITGYTHFGMMTLQCAIQLSAESETDASAATCSAFSVLGNLFHSSHLYEAAILCHARAVQLADVTVEGAQVIDDDSTRDDQEMKAKCLRNLALALRAKGDDRVKVRVHVNVPAQKPAPKPTCSTKKRKHDSSEVEADVQEARLRTTSPASVEEECTSPTNELLD